MRIYEDNSGKVGEMNKESTLQLEDDGRFSYSEQWSDYAGSGGMTIEGSWRREGNAIVLLPLRVPWKIGGWVEGQERKGIERGDTLDFGNGFTLRAPPDREEDIPVRNNGTKPLTVVLEPWGTRHTVAPGERVRVVARGPGGMGGLEIIRGVDEIVVYGWSGSQVAIVREQQQPKAAAPARLPGAEAAKPTAKPPVVPPAPAPADKRKYPRFVPRAPSSELAARIGRWVDELPAKGRPDWLVRLCQENSSIPLKCTQFYLWILRADGQVLCIDHDSGPRTAEPETDPRFAYAVLARGARDYPELGELLPPDLAGLRQCERCGGEGWTLSPPPAQGTDYCHQCDGMGWYVPVVPR